MGGLSFSGGWCPRRCERWRMLRPLRALSGWEEEFGGSFCPIWLSGKLRGLTSDPKTAWRRAWRPTPFMPGESCGQRILAGYSPQGHRELDTTKATEHTPRTGSISPLSFRSHPGCRPHTVSRPKQPGCPRDPVLFIALFIVSFIAASPAPNTTSGTQHKDKNNKT